MNVKIFIGAIIFMISYSCLHFHAGSENNVHGTVKEKTNVTLIILGTAQDAGSPQIGCQKDCCQSLFTNKDYTRRVVSLGVVDHHSEKSYLLEATPDMVQQNADLIKLSAAEGEKNVPDGIFLTHAHIGHYTGLMYLGKEAISAKSVLTYAMPGMENYLENNGPWQQLITEKNIVLRELQNEVEITLSDRLKVIPFVVPHRDEYSETVGYRLVGREKSAIFIPDIDKWERWDHSIADMISAVDYAFLDATFYDGKELGNRDMSLIPHPFVVESMEAFRHLPKNEKSKIYFIHFNHTNPLWNPNSKEYKEVTAAGYNVARQGMYFML